MKKERKMTNSDKIREMAEMIREAIPTRSSVDQPIWRGILAVLEQSGFGTKDARVDVKVPCPPEMDVRDRLMDDSFDGIQIKVLQLCSSILQDYGSVSIDPYSKGFATRSMTIIFTRKE